MADRGATVLRFPPIYHIAYSDGDECGIVAGFQSSEFWQAEAALYDLQSQYPELILWVTWKPSD